MRLRTALLLAALLLHARAASFAYSACSAAAYLSAANLQCSNCPANQIANTYQSVPTACQCALGFAPSGSGGCAAMGATCGAGSTTFYPLYSLGGSTSSVGACGSCAGNAFTNR